MGRNQEGIGWRYWAALCCYSRLSRISFPAEVSITGTVRLVSHDGVRRPGGLRDRTQILLQWMNEREVWHLWLEMARDDVLEPYAWTQHP